MTFSHLNEGDNTGGKFSESMTTESGTTMLFHEDNQMVISYTYKNSKYSNYRKLGDK